MLKTNFNRATECSKNNTTPDNYIPVATQGSKVMIYQICQQVKEARIFNGVTPTSSRHVIIFHVRAPFPSALCAEKPACSLQIWSRCSQLAEYHDVVAVSHHSKETMGQSGSLSASWAPRRLWNQVFNMGQGREFKSKK